MPCSHDDLCGSNIHYPCILNLDPYLSGVCIQGTRLRCLWRSLGRPLPGRPKGAGHARVVRQQSMMADGTECLLQAMAASRSTSPLRGPTSSLCANRSLPVWPSGAPLECCWSGLSRAVQGSTPLAW